MLAKLHSFLPIFWSLREICQDTHCTENHIFFFQMFWKDDLSKKIALEYDLSCIIRKDDISFSWNMILFLRHPKGRWSFSKKYLEIWYFLQMFWKDGLSKKFAPEHDLFCNIWKDGISFFQKIWYVFFRRKWKKIIFINKRVEIWYFLYTSVGVTGVTLPSWQKNKDASKKYT